MREMLEEVSMRNAQPNLEPIPFEGWVVKENYFCIALGYASADIKRGEKIYLRPVEIAKIFKLTGKAIDK